MNTHELKTWPIYFQAILDGVKTFECRKDDRYYDTGDRLILKEWSPDTGYTGRELSRHVAYIMYGGEFGLAAGYVAMSLIDTPIARSAMSDTALAAARIDPSKEQEK